MKTLLIDGNSLIHRAFYALPLLHDENGNYTNAVYGFLNMFYKAVNEYHPDNIAVAFDVHSPTFRHKRFAEYKAGRKAMPEELIPQIPLLKSVLGEMNVACCECPGYEADDIIGTYSLLSDNAGGECAILTGDRDALQLISRGTSVWLTKKGISETNRLDIPSLKEQLGLSPAQICDLKGLMGDSSDNIPGVAGIGEKTALKLLEEYSTIETLYEHVDEIGGKLGEKLRNGKDSAFESKLLATIVRNVPVEKSLKDCVYMPPQTAVLRALFSKYRFKSLLATLTDAEPEKQIEKQIVEHTEFAMPQKTPEKMALCFCDEYVSVAFNEQEEMRLNIACDLLSPGMSQEEIREILKPLLQNALIQKVLLDSKATLHRYGEINNIADDVSIAEYLLDTSKSSYELPRLCEKYNCDMSAAGVMRISRFQRSELEKTEMLGLYTDIELPLARVLFNMEVAGFYVKPEILKQLGSEFSSKINSLNAEIYALAGKTFNINSTKQLGEVLFGDLGLPQGRKTKTGFSTDNEVLEQLEHPIIAPIMEYRQAQKLKSTYIDGMLALLSPFNERIHTTFKQTVTATGRISSTEPNLQNIPVRTEYGRVIRKAFVAEKDDYVLVNADYSQIELRILAHLSGDQSLINAFLSGEDIHRRTAAEVFGISPENVTPHQRSAAKAVNFGIIYGISDFGLAKNIGTTRFEAKEYIEKYFLRYPRVKEFMEQCVSDAKRDGFVTTILSRRRYIPELSSPNGKIRAFGERIAKNAPIQGSAADIIKLAMIRVPQKLQNLRATQILQVHDELILEAQNDDAQESAKILAHEMSTVIKLSVPLEVDVNIGKSWFDLK